MVNVLKNMFTKYEHCRSYSFPVMDLTARMDAREDGKDERKNRRTFVYEWVES